MRGEDKGAKGKERKEGSTRNHSEICSFPGEIFSYLKFHRVNVAFHPDEIKRISWGKHGKPVTRNIGRFEE